MGKNGVATLQLAYDVISELRAMEQKGSLARVELVGGRLALNSQVPLAVVRERWSRPLTEQYNGLSPLQVVLGLPEATGSLLPYVPGVLHAFVEFSDAQMLAVDNRVQLPPETGDSDLARICNQLIEAVNRSNPGRVRILSINRHAKIIVGPKTYIFGIPHGVYNGLRAEMQRQLDMPTPERMETLKK